MRTKLLAFATVGMLAVAGTTGCETAGPSNGGSEESTQPRVGVILPDTKSAPRWITDDPKYLKAAFDAAGVPVEIKNAEGDPGRFVSIGEDMIANGVRVLVIANLDAASGKAVLDYARSRNVPTIDYDRLTVNGGADYYVSFDNERVGQLQAYGLQKCLASRNAVEPIVAVLNGSPGDSNATQFKTGYDQILQDKYDAGAYRKGPDQWVPDWSSEEAGVIFAQMLDQQPRIRGVLAANDGLAAAVIKVLRAENLNGKVPVTGQDATLEGLRNLLTGDQCVTVYKRIKPEAETAANLAVQLFRGERPAVGGEIKDPESGAYVKFASLPPLSIDVTQVKDVVADGFVTRRQLCTGRYETLCDRYDVE